MADTSVVIGGFALSEWEIPEKINIGGEHILVEQILIGGSRTIDAMGAKPEPITWKGRFRGPQALERAQALDEMRKAGSEISLSFFSIAKQVVIKKFHADIERFYEVSYEISVEVVTDDSSLGLSALAGALDGLISADMLSASTVADGANPDIGDALSPLQLVVTSSSGLSQSSLSQLQAFNATAVAAGAQIQSIADAAEVAIDPGAGMKSGQDPDTLISWLIGQGTNITTESQALDTVPYVNRMTLNISEAGN